MQEITIKGSRENSDYEVGVMTYFKSSIAFILIIVGLFLANKEESYIVFGKSVSDNRFQELRDKLFKKLNGWEPTFNNLKSLYLKAGEDWKKTPIPQAAEIQKEEAWKDMPQEAIDYIKSWEEFDADMFFEITGIRV